MLEKNKKNLMKNIFASFSSIKAVYLFGSFAENKTNRFSDIDIGILLEEGFSKSIKIDVLARLTEIGLDSIDLVIMNEAPLLLRHEIVKHNYLLYCKEGFDKNTYFSITVLKYLDFRPYQIYQQERFKERILNG